MRPNDALPFEKGHHESLMIAAVAANMPLLGNLPNPMMSSKCLWHLATQGPPQNLS